MVKKDEKKYFKHPLDFICLLCWYYKIKEKFTKRRATADNSRKITDKKSMTK